MKKLGEKTSVMFFVIPSFAGVLIFVLIPFVDVIRRSFMGAMNGEFTGLQNYQTIFENTAFKLAAGNTIRFMAVCMPLLIVLSLLVSLVLFNMGRISSVFKTTFLIPMAIPIASVVLLWRVTFHNSGFLNSFLSVFGIAQTDFMNSDWAFWVLVFSYIWKNLGYNVILWLAGLSAIPKSIYEAAAVDGANSWNVFWSITMPNLLPSLYTITVLSILNSFKVFREAYLVAGDYPHTSMYLIQHLFNNWFRDLSMDKLAAAAVLTAFTIFILIMLLRKAWEKD